VRTKPPSPHLRSRKCHEAFFPEAGMMTIRRFREGDWPRILPFLRDAVEAGDAFAAAPDSSEADLRHDWLVAPRATYVACADDGVIVGSYILKANRPGLGSHVCTCEYVVAQEARGQGVGTLMCEHSQLEAAAMGFRAMQFDLVVSTNDRAVRLWQKLGFAVVGILPHAFRHRRFGYVDAVVMYKEIVTPD
jgi:ribosomal protein S18 acetylase RimI-like enzyme